MRNFDSSPIHLFRNFLLRIEFTLSTEKPMKPQNSNSKQDLPDFDHELENDEVWNLLEDARSSSPSPRFVQDTLRRVRLDSEGSNTPWWQSLFAVKPLLGISGAALAALAIFLSLPAEPTLPADNEPSNSIASTEDWNELENAVASELLSDAAEDPTLLSDAEIVALLF